MTDAAETTGSRFRQMFDIGDVISAATGYLVSPTGMDGVYKILNFMTGQDLFTHQLPRASKCAAPVLLEQHPWLAKIDTSRINRDTAQSLVAEWARLYGPLHAVAPLPAGAYDAMGPLEELADMLERKP